MNKKSLFLIIGLLSAGAVFAMEVRQQVPFRVLDLVGKPDIYRAAGDAWVTLSEGDLVYEKDKIRTVANSHVQFGLSEQLSLKLERSSQFKGSGPRFFDLRPDYEGSLFIGSLLGATGNRFARNNRLTIYTPNAEIEIRDAAFRIMVDVRTGVDTIYVLRGRLEVKRREGHDGAPEVVRALEKLTIRKKVLGQPVMMDALEWQHAFGAYQVIPSEQGFNFYQQFISKRAGNLFKFVKEHGDFFTPRHGFVRREFYVEKESKDVILKIFYDIFPETAFVGFYMLTDDLDLSGSRYLEFEAKAASKHRPEIIYLEFKSRGEIVRAYTVRDIQNDWKKYRVPVRMGSNVRVDEIVLYLRHSMAKDFKQGTLLFRKFNLTEE